jgi:hypothetical protein
MNGCIAPPVPYFIQPAPNNCGIAAFAHNGHPSVRGLALLRIRRPQSPGRNCLVLKRLWQSRQLRSEPQQDHGERASCSEGGNFAISLKAFSRS